MWDSSLNLYTAKKSEPDADHEIFSARAVDTSNQLYGKNIMSAHEKIHGFHKRIATDIVMVPNEIVGAYQMRYAKRKLTKILRTRSLDSISLHPDDLTEACIKTRNQK